MATKKALKNEAGFKYTKVSGKAAKAGAAPPPDSVPSPDGPPRAAPAPEATRISGTKRRGGDASAAADSEPREVSVSFTDPAPHATTVVVAVDAARAYAAAVQRPRNQPAYFVKATEGVADAFALAATSLDGAARRKSSGRAEPTFRNPKNIANATRLASIKEHMSKFEAELAQWDAAAAEYSQAGWSSNGGIEGKGGGRRKSSRPSAVAGALVVESEEAVAAADALVDAAADEFRPVVVRIVQQLDRVAERLEATGAAIDSARELVSSASHAVRAAAFEDLPGLAGGGGAKGLIRDAPLLASTAGVGPTDLATAAVAATAGPREPTRTPRRLPAAALAGAAAAAASARGGRGGAGAGGSGRRGRGAPSPAAGGGGDGGGSEEEDEEGGSDEAPAAASSSGRDRRGAARPSVPDATPRIVGKIKRGKL